MKNLIRPVKGTRDFYPEQMAVRSWLYSKMREISEGFGYQEYESAMLEPMALYGANTTDELVRDQAYAFTDRGGSQITLRPELTRSLARMIAQRQAELTFPLRWWSFGPFWRYERPQKGRSREFFQWNVDLLGADSPEADAENVAVLASFFRRVGFTPAQVLILVNNRELMDSRLAASGIPAERRADVAAWIDRRAKMPAAEWTASGALIGLSTKQVFDMNALVEDTEVWRQSEDLNRFFAAIEALGFSEYVRFDASIVRGLAYYTGTVFEAWEVGGDIRRSILGGGRYDNLLADVGGDSLPAVGFAMGDVVMGLLLEKYGLLPANLAVNAAAVLVTVFGSEQLPASYALASELRGAGLNIMTYPVAAKLPKQFKYADKLGARFALVVGPDEIARGEVVIKDLSTGAQRGLRREAVAEFLRSSLGH
jgi:histidyl-tRNA synthetase